MNREQRRDAPVAPVPAPERQQATRQRASAKPPRQASKPLSGPGPGEQHRGRRAIVVLGMHRSGTSALTRILSLCGATLPQHQMVAAKGLPGDGNTQAGFWESQPIREIHDEVLASVGSSWDDLSAPHSLWFRSGVAESFKARLVQTVQEEFGSAPLFVVKDPRICRLVPLWRAVLDEIDARPAWVIPVRNPLEVAASLGRRDGIPQPKCLLLWLQHLLAGERDTRTMDRCFVTFEDLFGDWRSSIKRISRELCLSLPRCSSTAASEIDAFLDRSLRHHVVTREELFACEEVPDWVKTAYDWATRAASGREVDPGQLDGVAHAAENAAAISPLLFLTTELSLARESAQAEELDDEVNRLRQEIGQRHGEVARLVADLRDLQTRISSRDEQVARTSAERVELLQRADRLAADLAAWGTEIEPLRTAIGERDRQIDELRKKTEALSAQLMARETEIKRLSDELVRRDRRVAELTTRAGSLSKTIGEQNQQIGERSRAIGESRAELRSMCDELQQVQDQLRNRDERIAAIQLALGSRAFRPYEGDRGVSGWLRYSPVALALKAPLWLLTFSFSQRLKRWLEVRRILRSGLFDDQFYLSRYPEVAAAGIDPLYHFVRFGAAEGRDPNPLFSTHFYLSENPDVVGSGINPLVHFIHAGASEGRAPSPCFDTEFYLQQNPEVAEASVNPLLHYLRKGVWEGRAPKPQER